VRRWRGIDPNEPKEFIMQTKLFFIRGVVAIVWAAAFATTFDSLTAGTAALLVLYPVIDLVASVIDARNQDGSARRLLVANAGVSAVAAVTFGIAATGDKGDVLAAFGVWAGLTGAAQLVVALRRRVQFGRQWPMLLAGGVSTIGGVAFLLMSVRPDPTLMPLVVYAATGGVDFVIEAWLLRRRFRLAAVAPKATEATRTPELEEVRS
jgi:uncharacterized membrane protein HdeD (DUF308 family)